MSEVTWRFLEAIYTGQITPRLEHRLRGMLIWMPILKADLSTLECLFWKSRISGRSHFHSKVTVDLSSIYSTQDRTNATRMERATLRVKALYGQYKSTLTQWLSDVRSQIMAPSHQLVESKLFLKILNLILCLLSSFLACNSVRLHLKCLYLLGKKWPIFVQAKVSALPSVQVHDIFPHLLVVGGTER